ncbi:MAG TPA: DNA ligase-associated DEXH box helicase, partial [Thermoanaerobaculia bacterium]|nr:DNA ligase-associated DEXH box helicase [Thermoanaerobaculia bacterium]
RRRRGFDRGFVLSDHIDWPDLLRTLEDTGAERVLTTHGYAEPLARYLRERGQAAGTLATPFQGETED